MSEASTTVGSEVRPIFPELKAYLWATPNSRRVSILFEELGLSYQVQPINIRAGEQRTREIKALNPYARVPIVTWTGAQGPEVLFESGAILLHFAELCGDDLLPRAGRDRTDTLAWLMVAMTSLGPMTGNAHHWTTLAKERPLVAREHHVALVRRAYAVLDQRLSGRLYLVAGYSIADVAAFPWVGVHQWADIELEEFPHLRDWFLRIAERPAVVRGMAVPGGAVLG